MKLFKIKKEFLIEFFSHILVLGSTYIFFTIFVKNTVIVSGSMEPTLMTNDCALYNRLAYINDDVHRSDIICYWSQEYNEYYAKRVIGIAGDKVSFQDGYVFINDSKLDESAYLSKDIKTYCEKTFVVPDGYVFVLGDNRENSLDSRFFKFPFISI